MKLSILDQSPVSTGSTPADALQNSIDLAKVGDRLGYHRLWIAEHHAIDALASPAPEILIARLGAETSRIRLGSGGVMLPHYSAFKVAEQFRVLHALYPGRIDLGIGRAPGGSPLESYALRRNRKEALDDFPDQLAELLSFLRKDFPKGHRFREMTVSPEMPGSPDVWLLGSSLWSAEAAAQFGLPYAFAHFIDPRPTREAIELYRSHFNPTIDGARPKAIIALGVICAETEEQADYLFTSARLLFRRIRSGDRRPIPSPEEAMPELAQVDDSVFAQYFPDRGEWPRYVVGTPDKVKAELDRIADALKLDEIMIVTIVHDHNERVRSYELLAEAYGLNVVPGSETPTQIVA